MYKLYYIGAGRCVYNVPVSYHIEHYPFIRTAPQSCSIEQHLDIFRKQSVTLKRLFAYNIHHCV